MRLLQAPLVMVQDCERPPCGAPPAEVDLLRARGVHVHFQWFNRAPPAARRSAPALRG